MRTTLTLIFSLLTVLGFAQDVKHMKMFSNHLEDARDIWIITPSDFNENQSYPILYMHDGQNIMYDSIAFADTWKLRENLAALEQENVKLIVVGIANGGVKRMEELSFYPNPDHSSGGGKAYLSFLIEELMPVMESSYNIDKDNIGIMGSSLGGLISMQALAEFPGVFTAAGIFSPAFWFNPQTVEREYLEKINPDVKIYIFSGAKEVYGEIDFPKDQKKVDSFLLNHLNPGQYCTQIHPDGEHKEWYWAREFKDAVKFLFD